MRAPAADHHSFAEHEQIVDAISNRDLDGAARLMTVHLQSVARRLVPTGVSTSYELEATKAD